MSWHAQQQAGINTNSTKNSPSNDSTKFSNLKLYRQLVGALQYLILTRPDITYAVNKACQHMHQPTDLHFESLKRILRYIRGSIRYGFSLNPTTSFTLRAYTDADWEGDRSDRKSTTGYCTVIGSTLISWSAKKQTTVASSSTEAEYCVVASTATEII
ncbi:hypothetical protein KFK09_020961 [Dendrobium nobile]|uniref:Mitochondrial protein n=1 Tax=Dendrobium nobile TaxID=94219 RepID=A0A8T3ANE8_DENNO|nr:hypothetical protein KFK09_020961 [Dendrobium nobile]